jgi:hypothetical protein
MRCACHTLAGDLDELRERMIGVEMFHRAADYGTSNDAVVRVRATEGFEAFRIMVDLAGQAARVTDLHETADAVRSERRGLLSHFIQFARRKRSC